MSTKRLIWTVIFKEAAEYPQQEMTLYTEAAATGFAISIQDNGGVAAIVEGDEDIPEHDDIVIPQKNRGTLEW